MCYMSHINVLGRRITFKAVQIVGTKFITFSVHEHIDFFFFVKINAHVLNQSIDFQVPYPQLAGMFYLPWENESLQNVVCSC